MESQQNPGRRMGAGGATQNGPSYSKGREMFVPLFCRHTTLIERVFQILSPEELQQLELILKKISKRRESLADEKSDSQHA